MMLETDSQKRDDREHQARAQRAYLESRVLGADPLELLVMLYEGLQQSLLLGEQSLRARDWETAQEALSKARRIVTYLSQSLRPEGGEITGRLRSLYAYCFENIGRASLEKDPEPLKDVQEVVSRLAGAWQALLQKQNQPLPSQEER